MNIDFNKTGGLVPAIIQNALTQEVLMLGYMNEEALARTKESGKVTFYSRSKARLWTKGESSGNYLLVQNIALDCDQDTLLIQALPQGPTCHTGQRNCFGNTTNKGFLFALENTLQDRLKTKDANSYTVSLAEKGIHKVAQKVGEEAVELVIEALRNNEEDFKNEAADLLYHFILLLQLKGFNLADIEEVLAQRVK